MAEFVSIRRSAMRTSTTAVFSDRSVRRVSFLPVSQPIASNNSSTQTAQGASAVPNVEHTVDAHRSQTHNVVPQLQLSTISSVPTEEAATFSNTRQESFTTEPIADSLHPRRSTHTRTTSGYSFVCLIEGCIAVYNGIYKIVDKIASALVWCFSQVLILFCSHRVVVSGVARHTLSREDVRDEQLDALLDRCACGACRLPRWWCAYCCCVCDETEEEPLNTYLLSRCMRRWTQRIGLIVCFLASILVAYIVIAGTISLTFSCVAGRCAFSR